MPGRRRSRYRRQLCRDRRRAGRGDRRWQPGSRRRVPGGRVTEIAIVIPNFNGLEFLPLCLAALARQTTAPDEVVVVDNASTDGSPEMVEREYPDVKVVRLPRNT